MNTKHTPGPWRVRHLTASTEEAGVAHFELRAKAQGDTFAENKANARLIAAAPKLLEALIECRSQLRTLQAEKREPWSNERVNMVSAFCLMAEKAIAEATGETA